MDKKIKDRIDAIRQGLSDDQYSKTGMGILPRNWRVAKLSDIAEKLTQTAGTEAYETVSISAGIGFVNQAKKFGKELSGKQYEKYIVLHKGDFSYNKGNSNRYPQGCIYRLRDRETAAVPNVFESFKIQNECAEFYDHLFVSGFLNRQLSKKINHGVRDDGLLNLTEKDFYSCLLPVPPHAEQEKISEILDHYDEIIKLCEAKTNEYKNLKKTCLSKMFPQNGKTAPEIRFPGFMEDWEQRKLGDYVTITSGEAPSKFKIGSTNYVKVDDLNSTYKTIIDTQHKVSDNQFVSKTKAGSVIFPKRGAAILTNKVRILGVESYMDTNMMALTTSSLDSDFLYILISREGLYRIADTSTIPQINNKHIEPYEVILPTLVEQQRIGKFFTQLDDLIALHQREVEEYSKLKKAMTQLLMTGIVRIKT